MVSSSDIVTSYLVGPLGRAARMSPPAPGPSCGAELGKDEEPTGAQEVFSCWPPGRAVETPVTPARPRAQGSRGAEVSQHHDRRYLRDE
jgi:hypothetical protein